jgi:hypothetical protein
MPVASPSTNPSGFLVAATATNKAHLSRQARTGVASRLAKGLYLVGATLPRPAAILQHRLAIIAHFWPGSVLCDRTAMAGGVPTDGWIFIAHDGTGRLNDLHLDGLSISPRLGPGPLPGDLPMPEGLHLSGMARKLVENVTSRGKPPTNRPARQVGTTAVEDAIDELARTGGAGQIATVLAQLDLIASSLPAPAVELVRTRLAALLGTKSRQIPTSTRLAARIAGDPYDEHRLEMLAGLVAVLETTAPEPRPAFPPATRWQWEPFFEAYFSNYIEGTQFPVEVARQIAIDGRVPPTRPDDAHDVAATYRLVSDPATASECATSADEFIDLLRDRHAILMAGRPEKNPGIFKTLPNYAGGYTFVAPELVLGTLRRGFDQLGGLTDPLHRAIALMLLVTESHPFGDGNGRLARIVANAALSKAGQVRIVIPTVYRNNYLVGLSGVSNGNGRGETLISVLAFAQKWTSMIDWGDYQAAHETLEAANAYVDAGVADRTGLKLLLPA